MDFRFERKARKPILFKFGHGIYLDAWSILHIVSGFILGLIVLYLEIDLWIGLSFILLLLFLYEIFEISTKVAEDVQNSLSDIFCGGVGSILAFAFADHLSEYLVEAIGLSVLVALLIMFMGWHKYLKKKYRDAHSSDLKKRSKNRGPTAVRNVIVFLGLSIAIIPIPMLVANNAQWAVMWVALVGLTTAYLIYKRSIGQEIIIALFFALFVTSYQTYVYEGSNLFLGKINIFPLLGWTAGLVLLGGIYKYINIKKYKWFIMSLACIFLILFVEYIGYYWLGIKVANNPPSLFNSGIIHGTPFIHIFYLTAGPLYLLVIDYFRGR